MGEKQHYKQGSEMIPSCCIHCPYGKHNEICFPCYKDLLGQEGIKEWEKNHLLRVRK